MATKHYCYMFLLIEALIFHQLNSSPPGLSQREATTISDVGKESSAQILDPASDLNLNGRDGADKVCSLLKTNRHFSLNSFWSQEHDKIRDSLLYSPANKPFGKRSEELQKLIDKVLEALPPSRLRRSLRPQSVSPEHHPRKVRRILNIVWERYNAVNKASDKSSNVTQPHTHKGLPNSKSWSLAVHPQLAPTASATTNSKSKVAVLGPVISKNLSMLTLGSKALRSSTMQWGLRHLRLLP